MGRRGGLQFRIHVILKGCDESRAQSLRSAKAPKLDRLTRLIPKLSRKQVDPPTYPPWRTGRFIAFGNKREPLFRKATEAIGGIELSAPQPRSRHVEFWTRFDGHCPTEFIPAYD
jgi:hypothetical protein